MSQSKEGRKKQKQSEKVAPVSAAIAASPNGIDASEEDKRKKVKARPESIKVELFGDILKFSKKNMREVVPFKKYDSLAMALFNEDKIERIMLYMFLCGLALSAHARRTNEQVRRKELFDIKNKIFLSIANNLDLRRVLNFRFCVSKRFKVVKFCSECDKKNRELGIPIRDWKFCQNCTVDRTYYNVLSMFHKHKVGGASLFLGKELIPQVTGLKMVKHVNLEDLPERLTFGNYQYTPHNLIALDLASVCDVSKKLLLLAEKLTYGQSASTESIVTSADLRTRKDKIHPSAGHGRRTFGQRTSPSKFSPRP